MRIWRPNPSSIRCIQSGPAAKWIPRSLAPHHRSRNPLLPSWTDAKTDNQKKSKVFWNILEIFFIFAFFFEGSRWALSIALDTLRTVFSNVPWRASGSFSACRPTLVTKGTFNCIFTEFTKKITGFLTNTTDMVFAHVRGRSSTPAAVLQGCRWPQHRRPAWKVLNWSTRAQKKACCSEISQNL